MILQELTAVDFGFAIIKGTRHRPRAKTAFDEFGPVGDRRYCLVDPSTQRVLRTVQNPSLVPVDVHESGSELVVTLPTGESAAGQPKPSGTNFTVDYWQRTVPVEIMEGPHAALFSHWLGRKVLLARAPRGGVVFADPVSIATTGSVRELGRLAGHPDLLAEAARFRMTFLVDEDEPFTEEDWSGREVIVAGHRLRITAPIGRCAVIDLDPVTGERGSRLLKTLAENRPRNAAGEPVFGVCAEVVR